MSSLIQQNSLGDNSDEMRLIYFPTAEPTELFQKRLGDVQSILVRMILIGRKKGRPSSKEVIYEEAA